MIITDISQIDRLAEIFLSNHSDNISVDMDDYSFLKSNSILLKAIQLETQSLDLEIIQTLSEAFEQAGRLAVCNIIVHVCSHSSSPQTESITLESMERVILSVYNNFETANVIWGMSSETSERNYYSIVVFLGYSL